MKGRAFVVGVVSALAVLAAFAGPAQAANGVTVEKLPVSFSSFNPCTNETIDFTGSALVVIDTTPEDNHGLRFHSADMALKGVGQTTGTRYRSVFTITEVRQGSDEDGPFTETLSVHSRLIAPGPANDLVFSIVFHLTINAKGETVIIFNRLVDEACV